MKNGKEFLINKLSDGCQLTAEQLINKWIFENENELLDRLNKYIKSGKEKIGQTKFTMGQINAELLGVISRNNKLFTSKIEIRYIDTDNANFRIISDTLYLLR